jgi:hypothetical protein
MKKGIKEFKSINNPHNAQKRQKIDNNSLNQDINKNIKVNEHKDQFNLTDQKKPQNVVDYDMDYTGMYDEEYIKKEEKRFEAEEDKSETPTVKAKKLLEEGLIFSFVDFFYVYQRKIPNITVNYQKIRELPVSEVKSSEDHSSNLISIKVKLVLAERKYMRLKNFPIVINKFLEIRTQILQHQDHNSSVYFNQKAIDVAKSRELMDYLIFSFLYMGDCFQNPDDSIIRIEFKEQAKKLFEKHGARNPKLNLDKFLYESLMKLYEELATQQENQNNYKNAIDFLVKQLDNLKCLKGIVKDFNDKSRCEQDEIKIYLKVAELNYKQQFYEDANVCLEIAKDMLNKKKDDQNVNIYIF